MRRNVVSYALTSKTPYKTCGESSDMKGKWNPYSWFLSVKSIQYTLSSATLISLVNVFKDTKKWRATKLFTPTNFKTLLEQLYKQLPTLCFIRKDLVQLGWLHMKTITLKSLLNSYRLILLKAESLAFNIGLFICFRLVWAGLERRFLKACFILPEDVLKNGRGGFDGRFLIAD